MTPGKAFEKEVRDGIENSGGKVMRIPDPQHRPESSEEGEGKKSAGASRFTLRAPFDFLALIPFFPPDALLGSLRQIAPVAIECKSVAGSSIPFASVKPHQVRGLMEFANEPCAVPAGVMIEFRGDGGKVVYVDILQWSAEAQQSPRKSLTAQRAAEIGIVIDRAKTGKQRKERLRIDECIVVGTR